MTSRILVGPSTSKSEAWLNTSIGIATSIFLSSGRLKVFPPFLRPVVALFDADLRRIRRYHANARKILLPEIRRRRSEGRVAIENVNAGIGGRSEGKPNGDMIDWLDEESSGEDADPVKMVNRQLGLSFASVHTTTNHLTNVLFDLAARWKTYGPPLRQEIQCCMALDGTLSKEALTKLSKLDSFMKESQRLNPPSACKFCSDSTTVIADHETIVIQSKTHAGPHLVRWYHIAQILLHSGSFWPIGAKRGISCQSRGLRWIQIPP